MLNNVHEKNHLSPDSCSTMLPNHPMGTTNRGTPHDDLSKDTLNRAVGMFLVHRSMKEKSIYPLPKHLSARY